MAITTTLMLDAKTLETSRHISPSMLISTAIFGAANDLPAFYDSSVSYAYEDKILYMSTDGALLIKYCINKSGSTSTYKTADWADYSVIGILDDLKDSFNIFVDGTAADLQTQINQLNTDLTAHETSAASTYATKAQDALKLPMAGGTMTGQLTVKADAYNMFTNATSDSKYSAISNYTSSTPTASTIFGGFGGAAASGSGTILLAGLRLPSASTFNTTANLLTGFSFVKDSATAGHTVTVGSLYPSATNVDSLGTSSLKYANVYATTFYGALSGNATTASSAGALTTARTIALSGGATGTATSFNGTANIIIPVTSLDATKLTGTASISTTGNAGTATTLQNARTINGVSFNGSSNITITAAPNAHNQASNTITAMTGYSVATSAGTVTTSDSLNGAVGKIEYKLNDAYKLRTGVNMDSVLLGLNSSTTGTSFSAIGDLGTGFMVEDGTITVKGAFLPSVTNTYNLGSSALKFANVYATNIVGAVSGNSTTATTLATARTIAISGGATGTATSFNGSANITIPVTSLDATKLSGTAAVSTTGNAATATTLQTARTIALSGGATGTATSFNGSANITIPVTSLDVTKLSGTASISTTGNAATATTLQNARTINGVSFNGSANITIQATDPTKLPTAGGTMTGILTAPKILINNADNSASGISWYNSSFTSWIDCMCTVGSNKGYSGTVTFSAGSLVTTYARRSVIEPQAGYGWTWESMASTGTTSSIVAEMASANGNFRTIGSITAVNGFVGTLTGSITGNAATATTLATARTIALSGAVTGSATSFNGSANITIPTTSVDATKLSGTASIATTGNAGTATKLQTARTINGVSFDGSANITIEAVPAAHTHPSSNITAMTGYAIATSAATISTSDSLNTAIGKLEQRITTNATNIAACWDANGHLVSPVGGWSLWVTTEAGPSSVAG